MKWMRWVAFATAISFLPMLQGCPSLGLTQPQSTEDKFQYAKATLAGTYRSIGDLKAQKRITAAEGSDYFDRAEQAETTLTTVEPLVRSGAPTAASQVQAILVTILALEAELNKRKPQ